MDKAAKPDLDPTHLGLLPLEPGTEPYRQHIQEAKALQDASEAADPELRRRRERQMADMQARSERFHGRNPEEAGHQEDLIRDARKRAEGHLIEANSPDARIRISERIHGEYKRDYPKDYQLLWEPLHKAIWTEGYPSLEERAAAAGLQNANQPVFKSAREKSVNASEKGAPNPDGPGSGRPGRPLALREVDGALVKKVRGELSQKAFVRSKNFSEDTLQQAERLNRATDDFLDSLCRTRQARALNLKPEDFLKN